jgi:hypothetical protein
MRRLEQPPAVIPLIAIVVSGGVCGLFLRYPGGDPPMFFRLGGVLAVLMMCAGTMGLMSSDTVKRRAAILGFGCVCYSVGAMILEPFLWPRIWGAAALVPLLLAFPHLYRCRLWASAGGVALFVFVATVMAVNNAISLRHGSGFFTHWN